ncbi:MAG: uracil phosphoribosyltransferase [Gammaproteobacteria bacterium]|nr:uracil phosphoribosyltransferase [Gammaproteobacteria bacterium]
MHVEVKHPCIQHKLAILRDAETGHKRFRELATEITMFVCYDALKHVEVENVSVETPVATAQCQKIANDIVVVPILRAGVGMLDGILGLVPTARVGFMGMYRDEATKKPVEYYNKVPANRDALYIVIDPMLATGGSTTAALDILKKNGVEKVIVVCIVTCPEGIERVEQSHPDVTIYTAAVDERLNEKKYIVPGLGDAGDRLFGTR